MTAPDLRWPVLLSIAAALSTIVLKGIAYAITGSVGLFSDALESVINLVAALTAFLSLWYAARPADPNHTFGHEKIEFFSSGLEGALVAVAGLGTIWYAVRQLLDPGELARLDLGVILAISASVINFVVARILLTVGRRHGSIVLEADGHHLMSDVWTSVAVVVGLGLVAGTGYHQLDAIVALAVGSHIVWTGFKLIRRSFDGLMDHALPVSQQARLRQAIESALPEGADYHLLRTRQAGRRKFADFHLLFDGSLSLRAAHSLAHDVEAKLRAADPDLQLSIHIEPIDEVTSWEEDDLARLGEAPTPRPRLASNPPIDD